MRYIYGPIDSWRLKRSLGVDLISQEGRVCSFDCIYCQIRNCQELTSERRKFVEIEDVREELLEALDKVEESVDYLTFSGMGEPTLASNLNEAVAMLEEVSEKPKAILTNGSLLNIEEVKRSLKKLDYVIASLDAADDDSFEKVNRPAEGISFAKTVEGCKNFREIYDGTFAVEIMFVKENKHLVEKIADIVINEIQADEVQLNTPLRPSVVEPLKERELKAMEHHFD
ncbi:MAG: radical SAM protein, partial [Candidatus Thermoplasmatota archaeon]|nr:radical SAM protein [Candidatus Thermoplasmatota archaeon]